VGEIAEGEVDNKQDRVGGVTDKVGRTVGGISGGGKEGEGKGEQLRLRIELDLDLEIQLTARIKGSVTLGLLS